METNTAANELKRVDGRGPEDLRPLTFTPHIAPNASGSVLVGVGSTRVICAATIEKKVPGWMRAQKVEGGWLTAEYSMLPYSTHERKARAATRGKQDGRAIEIQRLIGRSLRSVVDLKKLGPRTLWVDCDVLEADGGTRTASITGAYVAAKLAINALLATNELECDPFTTSVSGISAGICEGKPLLDLNYVEDKAASVDANIVMTGLGEFVEVQSSGEEATYSRESLQSLLDLCERGNRAIQEAQEKAIESALEKKVCSRFSGPGSLS